MRLYVHTLRGKKKAALGFNIALLSQCLLYSSLSSAIEFSDLMFAQKGRERLALLAKDKQPYTGVAVSYYDNGNKRSEAYYLNGKNHGPSFRWFEDGRLKSEAHWLNGKKQGVHQEWAQEKHKKDADGNAVYYPKKRQEFQFGKLNGESEMWNRGRRYVESSFVNGRLNGSELRWETDKNGQSYLRQEEPYLNAKKTGLMREFFSDQQTKEEGYYTAGNREGLWLEFELDEAQSLQPQYVQFYQDDEQQGLELQYGDGVLRRETSYRNDSPYGLQHKYSSKGVLTELNLLKETGKRVRFYRNTNIRESEINRIRGISEAWQFYWFPSGNPKKVRFYHLGEITPLVTEWHQNGRKEHEISDEGKSDAHLERQWYANGQLKTEGYLTEKGKIGLHQAWYKNGQLKSQIHYSAIPNRYNTVKDGKETQWYSNGQIMIEMTYRDGQAVGTRRTWLDDGTLYSEKEMGI